MSPGGFGKAGTWARRLACACAALVLASQGVSAADPGLKAQRATVTAQPALNRDALIVVTQPRSAGSRIAAAHDDAATVEKVLRDLAFNTQTLGPLPRAEMTQAVREAAAAIPEGRDLAVFILGTSYSDGTDVFLMPPESVGQTATADSIATDGVRFSDLLRRLGSRNPSSFVVILDECQNLAQPAQPCAIAPGGSAGVSVIASQRFPRQPGASPVAATPSLGAALIPAITEEGANVLKIFQTLQQKLTGTDLSVIASPALSTTFTFVPRGVYPTFQLPCNTLNPDATADQLRAPPSVQPIVTSCEQAVTRWPSATYFATQLAAAREQLAFQKAVASCTDRAATQAYITTYRSGRYLSAVNAFAQDCQRRGDEQRELDAYRKATASCDARDAVDAYRRDFPSGPHKADIDSYVAGCTPSPAPARGERIKLTSRAGYTLTYDGSLLQIAPDGNDLYDSQKKTYNVVWNAPGNTDVVVYMQVSANTRCQAPSEYMDEVIAPRRDISSGKGSLIGPGGREYYYLAARGFIQRNPNGTTSVLQRSTYDIVGIRRSDKGAVLQLGGRFPAALADTYKAEINAMMLSLRFQNDPFSGGC